MDPTEDGPDLFIQALYLFADIDGIQKSRRGRGEANQIRLGGRNPLCPFVVGNRSIKRAIDDRNLVPCLAHDRTNRRQPKGGKNTGQGMDVLATRLVRIATRLKEEYAHEWSAEFPMQAD